MNAARAISPTTELTDGVPPKAMALISNKLLQVLADMGNAWVESAVWPASEQMVHIALLPKPTSGEWPIGLFRSLIRVVCKAAAWSALKRFEKQELPQLNTSKGRCIGDVIWRAQMRSQIGATKHAEQIMIDLLKAFEYVDKAKLAEEVAPARTTHPSTPETDCRVR